MPQFLPQTNRGCDTHRPGHPSADALGVVALENLILTLDVAYPKAFLLQVFALLRRPATHQSTLCSLPSVFFTRIGVSIWNSIRLFVKTLNISNFRKKIKSLLLNVLGNEDNYLNVNFLIEYVVYTSSCNFSLFQITKSLVLEFICNN